MKKFLLSLTLVLVLACSLALMINAKEAYIEEIPSNLRAENDTAKYFVVFEGEEYYTGGATINGLNNDNIKAELDRLGVASVGKEYLTKLVFPNTLNGVSVERVDFDTGVKKNTYFNNTCGAYVLPEGVKAVTNMNDCSGQLRSIDFGKNNTITTIPYCFANKASNLREVKNFPTNLDVIDEYAFSGCDLAFHGEMYVNATTVKRKAFENAIGLDVTGIVFGPRVKNMQTEAFGTREKAGSINVKYIEFQGDITQITGIVASGDNVGAFYFEKGTQRNQYSSLVHIVLSNPAQADCLGKTFQDYLPRVYFNQASMNGGNIVVPSHTYLDSLVSYDNFFDYGSENSTCSDCGYTLSGKILNPIFVDRGYSCSQIGSCSIAFSVYIDYEALDYYNKHVSEENRIESYGLLAANKELVGNSAFDEMGQDKKGTVSASFNTFGQRSYVDIKVNNLKGVNVNGEDFDYTGKELFITAYCVVNGGVVYLDNGKMSDTLNTTVSYDSILGLSNG